MANVIWKYELKIKAVQDIELPLGAEPLSVQVQNGKVCIWTTAMPASITKPVRFYIVGTGDTVPDSAAKYLGTVQVSPYVWHFFYARTWE